MNEASNNFYFHQYILFPQVRKKILILDVREFLNNNSLSWAVLTKHHTLDGLETAEM